MGMNLKAWLLSTFIIGMISGLSIYPIIEYLYIHINIFFR